MAKFIYELNQSLDGYVDHDKFAPGPVVFRYFIEQTKLVAGMIYGRNMYEIMRYWDTDSPHWSADEREYATAWRSKPKWVVSRTLESVGPNATLIAGEFEAPFRRLKSEMEGDFEVAGTVLAQSLSALGLIDEYRLDIHPVVVGSGTPFFRGSCPPLRHVSSDAIGEGVVQLIYVPA